VTIRLTPRAEADLEEIWDYTASGWGIEQAEHYIRELWRAMVFVAADPRRGKACDDVRSGYRRYPAGSHLIFYRTAGRDIEVVRVLHQRMDHERHL
jgi:toxin ParE1/3/4